MSDCGHIKQEYFPSKVKMVEVSFPCLQRQARILVQMITVKIFSALQCNLSALTDPQDMWQYDFMIYH